VTIYLMEKFDREANEARKWFSLPPWQARPELERQMKRLKGALRMDLSDALFGLLQPTTVKVLEASTRIQRQVASLRVVEAIRLYAAAHEGKLPATLSDVTEAALRSTRHGQGLRRVLDRHGRQGVLDGHRPRSTPVVGHVTS
jgi:hypothetical protein